MAGDAEAPRREFEAHLEPLLDTLFGAALRLTRSRADAEDVVQESVMRAWRSFAQFERGSHFKAWILKILTNTFLTRVRTAKRRPATVPFAEGEDPATGDEDRGAAGASSEDLPEEAGDVRAWERLYGRVVDDELKGALDRLPDEFRAPLLLSTLGELSYKEIADALELPIGTVMSRLFRARGRLREQLTDYARGRGLTPGPDGERSAAAGLGPSSGEALSRTSRAGGGVA